MDKSIYTAMSGAVRTLTAQSTVSNNLANASTVGFRAELAMAKTAPLDGAGLPTRVASTFGGAAFDPSAGTLMTTERPLDVAVRGNGWIAVQDGNGETAYTRNGELQIDALGQLMTNRGELVLGEGGPVAIPPNESVTIGDDGTISVIPQGQGAVVQATVDRIRVDAVQPQDMRRGDDGLFRPVEDAAVEPVAGASLSVGTLESSNVNLAQSLVDMIALSRQFELQVKAIRSADDNAQAAAAVMRING
ncbi:flagellar basal-body rod protein FlgF [uncultured Abyssibacter sp.]|uniref:flagellar basal-body rod protein FlgF n=1 Tax=uncultured Abyssibacter sp. TaxID=2320202 RepID=UPI0032B17AE9